MLIQSNVQFNSTGSSNLFTLTCNLSSTCNYFLYFSIQILKIKFSSSFRHIYWLILYGALRITFANLFSLFFETCFLLAWASWSSRSQRWSWGNRSARNKRAHWFTRNAWYASVWFFEWNVNNAQSMMYCIFFAGAPGGRGEKGEKGNQGNDGLIGRQGISHCFAWINFLLYNNNRNLIQFLIRWTRTKRPTRAFGRTRWVKDWWWRGYLLHFLWKILNKFGHFKINSIIIALFCLQFLHRFNWTNGYAQYSDKLWL